MATQPNPPHIPAAPDIQDGKRTRHLGALDHAANLKADLAVLEATRRIDADEMPKRAEQIRRTVGEINRLDEQKAVAQTRMRIAEAQVLTLERHVGAHSGPSRWRTTGELALLGAMALGESLLAYPAFKEAVPSSTGGTTDPILDFLVGHGALFVAIAVGAGSAWLQRRVGADLAHALRSVLRDHHRPATHASSDLIADPASATV